MSNGMKVVAWRLKVYQPDGSTFNQFVTDQTFADNLRGHGIRLHDEPLVTLADAEAMIQKAFDAGFRMADAWTNHVGDLVCDMDSPAYELQRANALAKLGERENG